MRFTLPVVVITAAIGFTAVAGAKTSGTTAIMRLTPVYAGSVGGSMTIIDASPGEQTDPHVSGNIVAYTDEATGSGVIRYYNFLIPTLSGTIPVGVGDVDQFSDVNGRRISFSRQHGFDRSAMVFDLVTLTTTVIGLQTGALETALGGDTVAFVTLNDDILVGKISTPLAPLVNLANPLTQDASPAVSPLGETVVWESCESAFNTCDVMKAIRSGGSLGSWGFAQLVSGFTAARERNPDTDGIYVTYESDRLGALGGGDIFFRPLLPGPETQIELYEVQRNPSIADGLIAFESQSPGETTWDLFVYEPWTNRLFRVTDTPFTNETLSDITTLSNGDVRIVWAADDDIIHGYHNIYARTFSLPAPDFAAPTITLTTPNNGDSYAKGQVVLANFSCQDEPGGSGLASCTSPVANGSPIDTATAGSYSFAVTATDNAGNTTTATSTYTVTVPSAFVGFFQPVDNLPTLNVATAGSAIPVKFSLGGYVGLAIFAAGFPASSPITCTANEPGASIEETVTAGGSSLSYDAATGEYSYTWKTDKAWKGACRLLVVQLNDGSVHYAKFRFR